MPELPEVEIVKRGLAYYVEGKTIQAVTVYYPPITQSTYSIPDWPQKVEGETIHSLKRRGKYIIFELDHFALISHLRMEGKYYYYPKNDLPHQIDKHTHLVFTFTDQSQLHYHDVRKFGRIEAVKRKEVENYFQAKKLGLEPFDLHFTADYLYEALKHSKARIKSALLSQRILVGLGNIYVDEVLYQARIHPLLISNQITKDQARVLHQAIIEILGKAIKQGGSTIRSYKNTFGEAGNYQEYLKVYGKEGQACPQCGSQIEKIKVAQRGTYYCPHCQIAPL